MAAQRAWKVAHSSKTGTRHQDAGQDCQDFSCHLIMPRVTDDTIIAAVADGLGQATHGGPAARIAAETACETAASILWEHRRPAIGPERLESLLNAAVLDARMALETQAEHIRADLQELSTTLLLLVHTAGTIATAQVGDGAAVISTKPGEYHTLAKPQRGEYANETTALTSRRVLQKCEITIAHANEPVREIAMLTDGLLNVCLDSATLRPHPPFFRKFADWLRQYPSHLHPARDLQQALSTGFIARRTDDDLTLLLAVRNDQP